MLIAMTILLLTGGGAGNLWLFPKDFTDRVEVVVTDESRQEAVTGLYDEIASRFADHNERVKEISGDARTLNGNYDANQNAFGPVIDRLLQARRELQTAVLDTRIKMVEQVNEKEWQQLFAADSTLNNN